MKKIIAFVGTFLMIAINGWALEAVQGTLSLTPVVGPEMKSASFPEFARQLIADAKTGSYTEKGYTLVKRGKIEWNNLVVSQNRHSLGGLIDPPPPNDKEFGDPVYVLVQAEAMLGDGVSLAPIIVGCGSDDPSNSLGSDPLSFYDDSYGSLAIGIKADKTEVTSGPATQLVSRVIFLARMKMFVADTQSAMEEVRRWVTSNNLRVIYSARFSGVPGSVVTTTVGLTGYTITAPIVTVMHDSSGVTIKITDGAGQQYTVQQSNDLLHWSDIGQTTTGKYTIPLVGGNAFYRVYTR